MRQPRALRPPATLAAVLALLASVFLPPQWAQAVTVLTQDHTDAFHIVTDGGVPVMTVANGAATTLYDPSAVELHINATTYATDHSLQGFSQRPVVGYFTGSWDADPWFEPGWNAPNFAANGFAELRIDFTSVTGPGQVALIGNPEGDDEDGVRGSYLSGGRYVVGAGASLPVHGHEHAHWYFSHAGTYRMHGEVVGKKTDGTVVTSDPFTLTWSVERHGDDHRDSSTTDDGASDEAPGEESDGAPDDASGGESDDAPGGESDEASDDAPALDATPIEIDHGHVDLLAASSHDGNLALTLKDDRAGGTPIHRKPEAVTLRVRDNAWEELPAHLHDRMVTAGYVLPQHGKNQQTVVFPGWDTFGAAPDFREVEFEFLDVQGPGRINLFIVWDRMRSPFVSGGWDLRSGEVIRQRFPAHMHATWVFEKPGVYTMKVRARGVPVGATDQTMRHSEPRTYTFVVGPDEAPQPEPSDTSSADAPSEVPGGGASGASSEVPSGGAGGPSSTGAASADAPSTGKSLTGVPSVVPASSPTEGSGGMSSTGVPSVVGLPSTGV